MLVQAREPGTSLHSLRIERVLYCLHDTYRGRAKLLKKNGLNAVLCQRHAQSMSERDKRTFFEAPMPCSPFYVVSIKGLMEEGVTRSTDMVPPIDSASTIILSTQSSTALRSSGLEGLYMRIWWKLPSPTWPKTLLKIPRWLARSLDESMAGQVDSLNIIRRISLTLTYNLCHS